MLKNNVAEFWDERGEQHAENWESKAKEKLNDIELEFIDGLVERVYEENNYRTIKVLDIGMGLGRVSEALLKHDIELSGMDISKKMIDYCRGRFSKNKKVKDLIVQDIGDKSVKRKAKYDLVLAVRVLEWTEVEVERKNQLKNICKFIKPGGYLFLTFPNKVSGNVFTRIVLGSNYHGSDLSLREIKSMLHEADLEIDKIRGYMKLFDTFYNNTNNSVFVDLLFFIEKLLNYFLGELTFTRVFHIVCKKI